MLATHPDQCSRRGPSAHRNGDIEFTPLVTGPRGSRGNFEFTLAMAGSGFSTPRHRHNFDQVRIMLEGRFSFGRDQVQEPGSVGYFPEGCFYQQQGLGRSVTLLLQLGGANGEGYMDFEQLYRGAEEIRRHGEFHDGIYTVRNPDGTLVNKDGHQAVWEHVFGRPLKFLRPRYQQAIIMAPDEYHWLPAPGGDAGVQRKLLGVFTERALGLWMLRLDAGAGYVLSGGAGGCLLFVRHGTGKWDAGGWLAQSTLHLAAGEQCRMQAETTAECYGIDLPAFV